MVVDRIGPVVIIDWVVIDRVGVLVSSAKEVVIVAELVIVITNILSIIYQWLF